MSKRDLGPGCAGLCLLALLACGCSEPAAGPSQGAAPSAASAVADERPTADLVVRLEPSQPTAEQEIRAIVESASGRPVPGALQYAWELDGRRLDLSGPSVAIPNSRGGQRVSVIVGSDAGSPPVRASVLLRNSPPEITSVSIEPGDGVQPGSPLRARVEVTDPDGEAPTVTYTWEVNGLPVGAGDAIFATDTLSRGDRVAVNVTARDASDDSDEARSEPVRILNAPPAIVSQPDYDLADGTFRYALRAEDPDGDRSIRFQLAEAPEGMQIDPFGVVTWKPAPDQLGSFPVQIVADDRHGGRDSQAFQIHLRAGETSPARAAD